MTMPLRRSLLLPLSAALASTLTACSFEPPLRLPETPAKVPFTAHPAPGKTVASAGSNGRAQEMAYGKDLDQQWWTLFHSRTLDAVIQRALKNSPTIAQAQAQLRQAEATARVNASIFYPQVTGTLGANRSKQSSAAFGGNKGGFYYTLFTGSVGVTYYPDIFGVNRLIYRGGEAQVAYQRYELEAARLTLTGNIVNTAIGEAATQAQIAATRAIVAREQTLLDLTENQYRAGAIPYLTVVNQRAQLATQMATLPQLEQQLAVYRHEMAILVGSFPGQWQEKPFTLEDLSLPTRIPVSLPSEVVKQRPDIQAALNQLKAANAQIGVARAQFYPTVALSASFGDTASTVGMFFNPISSVWSLVGGLSQPLFEGGKLEAQKASAYAAYDASFNAYRNTVLTAFQQVANALRALEHDAQALAAQQESLQAAREALTLAQSSYRAGATDYLSLLTAEVQYNTAKIAEIKAEAQRYQDTAALLVALGGGWWNTPAGDHAVADKTTVSREAGPDHGSHS